MGGAEEMTNLMNSTAEKRRILLDPTTITFHEVGEIPHIRGRVSSLVVEGPRPEDAVYLLFPDNFEEAVQAIEIESGLYAVAKESSILLVKGNTYSRASGSPACNYEYAHENHLKNSGELVDHEHLTESGCGLSGFFKNWVSVRGKDRDASDRSIQVAVVEQETLWDESSRASKASFSWKMEGKLSPVTNQGMKKTCWAHAVIAILEAKFFIENNEKLQLSRSNLLSNCSVNGSDNYPYSSERALRCIEEKGIQGICVGKTLLFKSMGIIKVSVDNEHEIKMAVSQNPVVAVIIPTMAFQNLLKPKDTVLHVTEAEFNWFTEKEVPIYHAVIITGWCVKNGEPVWEAQNSYGERYRDGGFFYIARGTAIKPNEVNPLIDVLYAESFKKVDT